jgi:hypothetical protein
MPADPHYRSAVEMGLSLLYYEPAAERSSWPLSHVTAAAESMEMRSFSSLKAEWDILR